MAELDPEKLNTENKEVENKEETTAEESKESQPVEAKVEETKKDEKGVETLETEEGVYTKKEADVQKNFIYKNASGKVDGVNLKLADAIENARKNFVKNYRSNRLGANISVGIFAFFIVATAVVYFTLSQTENKTLYNCLMWPFFGLAIVALVCFLILSNVGKKKATKRLETISIYGLIHLSRMHMLENPVWTMSLIPSMEKLMIGPSSTPTTLQLSIRLNLVHMS